MGHLVVLNVDKHSSIWTFQGCRRWKKIDFLSAYADHNSHFLINCSYRQHCMKLSRSLIQSGVLEQGNIFQTGRAAMIAQFTIIKHTDHFGLVNGTIWQLFKRKLYIQNLIGIHFGVSRLPSTQNVTLAYYYWPDTMVSTSTTTSRLPSPNKCVRRACCFADSTDFNET